MFRRISHRWKKIVLYGRVVKLFLELNDSFTICMLLYSADLRGYVEVLVLWVLVVTKGSR